MLVATQLSGHGQKRLYGVLNGFYAFVWFAPVTSEDEVRFYEEGTATLSDADRDGFLHLLVNPPDPSPALERAAARRGLDS